MGEFGIGQPVRRREDPRLLRGEGRFLDDEKRSGLAHGFVLRAPYAHAQIRGIDTGPARSLPGVLAVLTAADLAAAGIRAIAPVALPAVKAGTRFHSRAQPALAADVVRYCGEAVAFVVAETPEAGRAAREAVVVDYAPLPAVTDCAEAALGSSPAVWPVPADNVCFLHEAGDAAATDAAFAAATTVVRLAAVNNRVVLSALEPRSAIGETDGERLVLHTGTQMPHPLKAQIAAALDIDAAMVRVVVKDVGGGFGGKNSLYPEQILVLLAARRLGRPVKWVSDRSEAFLSDFHGRDNVYRGELALDAEQRILGIRVRSRVNLGAYLASRGAVPPQLAPMMTTNAYAIPCMHVEVAAMYTHTVPTDPYRGAGRPEMTYLVERLMDHAAREVGLDPVSFRKRNLIPADAFPYLTPSGLLYDPCQFAAVMDAALERARWSGFPARQEAARARGRLRGIGISNYVERCGGGGGLSETATLEAHACGTVRLLIGSMANGQGHETAYSQILSERLGIGFEHIEIVQGDTDRVPSGIGTGGSWSIPMGGAATAAAAQQLVERLRPLAAEHLEAASEDLELREGVFTVGGTDLGVGLLEIASQAAGRATSGVLVESSEFKPENYTFPYGCHVCEVDIDPQTGQVAVVAYTAVHDFGTPLNPLLLGGQVHGGVVQGIGQALTEHTVYDTEGQLLSGSFMDYGLPRADDLPGLDFTPWVSPAPSNPLDIKGCGEAGATGSCPAVMNAVVDALRPAGVATLDMPATPQRVWEALRAAQAVGRKKSPGGSRGSV